MLLLSTFLASAHAHAANVEHPWSLTGTVGAPGGFGIDWRYRFTEGFALSAQASSWLLFTEYGARGHWYAARGERVSFVVSGGVHGLDMLLSLGNPVLELESTVGVEWKARSGFTLGADLGPSLLVWGDMSPTPFVFGQTRVGWSW